jgi:hypothetical protein
VVWQDQNSSHVPLSGLNTDEQIDGKPREEIKSYSDFVLENKEAIDLMNRQEGPMKEQIMYHKTANIYVKVIKPESPKSDSFECMVLPENTKNAIIHRNELCG